MAIQINGTSGISGVDGSAGTPALQGTDSNTGISFGTDEVNINTGGSTRATVDSSGLVGIGTSSPATLLEIASNATNQTLPGIPTLRITNTDTTAVANDNVGSVEFFSKDASEPDVVTGYIRNIAEDAGTKYALTFGAKTNGVGAQERLRITAAGNVGIGTPSPTSALDVTGQIRASAAINAADGASNSASIRFWNANTGFYHPGSDALGFVVAGVERARLDSSGKIYSLPTYNNTAAASANMHVDSNGIFYRATSSAKYKTDIETLEDQYADALLNVRPVWYRSTTGNEPTDWSWYGFIAEEVAEIDPRLVHWKTVEGVPNENGQIEYTELETPVAEGVQYDRFVPHLLNLIKRQQQAIETLETRLTALEGGAAQ
jgi:hypothetical protein